MARLARGVSRRQAQAELDLLSRDYAAPDGTKPRGSTVTDSAFFSHPSRMTPNGPLVAAALVSSGLLLVWLLACANIGNLMLARAAVRTREIGIRLSLGASRARIVRQLLTEGFVLALAGGTLGVAVAYELPFVILRVMGGPTASFPFRVAVDGVVLGYAVLIAALSSIAFGLAPALHATRADVRARAGRTRRTAGVALPSSWRAAGDSSRGQRRAAGQRRSARARCATSVHGEYWPHDNPIGKTLVKSGGGSLIRRGAGPPPPEVREIVGIVKNAHTNSLYEFVPMFYQVSGAGRPMPKLIVRTSGPVPSNEIARIVERLDSSVRTQTIALAATLEERMQETRVGPMFAGVLGASALGLATIGMFGVFAYAVRQRTREIGIRMALGAQPSAVVRLVIGSHSRAVIAGLIAGTLGGVVASFVLRSRLHGLSPFDLTSYVGVAAILTIAFLAASYVPARRASRVDPAVALRHD